MNINRAYRKDSPLVSPPIGLALHYFVFARGSSQGVEHLSCLPFYQLYADIILTLWKKTISERDMRYSTSVPHLSRQSWFSRPAASRSRRNNISKLWTPGQDSTFTASTDEAIGSTALFSKFPCVKACKDQNHLTRYQYQTLAEWAGAVALHSTEGGFKELPWVAFPTHKTPHSHSHL